MTSGASSAGRRRARGRAGRGCAPLEDGFSQRARRLQPGMHAQQPAGLRRGVDERPAQQSPAAADVERRARARRPRQAPCRPPAAGRPADGRLPRRAPAGAPPRIGRRVGVGARRSAAPRSPAARRLHGSPSACRRRGCASPSSTWPCANGEPDRLDDHLLRDPARQPASRRCGRSACSARSYSWRSRSCWPAARRAATAADPDGRPADRSRARRPSQSARPRPARTARRCTHASAARRRRARRARRARARRRTPRPPPRAVRPGSAALRGLDEGEVADRAAAQPRAPADCAAAAAARRLEHDLRGGASVRRRASARQVAQHGERTRGRALVVGQGARPAPRQRRARARSAAGSASGAASAATRRGAAAARSAQPVRRLRLAAADAARSAARRRVAGGDGGGSTEHGGLRPRAGPAAAACSAAQGDSAVPRQQAGRPAARRRAGGSRSPSPRRRPRARAPSSGMTRLGVPRGARAVQAGELAGVVVGELRLEHLAEQRMDAEAAGRAGRLLDEGVRARQPGEDAPAVGAAAEPVDQVRPQLRGHADPQQEPADRGRLALQHLGEQVLGDAAVVVGERRDQLLRRRRPASAAPRRAAGRPPSPRSPRTAPRPPPAVTGTPGGEQLAGLLGGEGQLVGADLRQRAGQPVPVQRQQRVGAAAQHQAQPAGRRSG